MIFHETTLPGAYLIDLERIEDDRGFNARTWCEQEFADQGLTSGIAQSNTMYNRRAGTLRGMHWQVAPSGENKLFRVLSGAIHDVILDLREGSETYGQWESFRLSAGDGRLLYVPELFAQGYQTLEDDTEVAYQVSMPYTPDHGRGMRWDDPAFDFDWPLPIETISEKDKLWPDFVPARPLSERA